MGLPATAYAQQQLRHPLCNWAGCNASVGCKNCSLQHQHAVFVNDSVLLPGQHQLASGPVCCASQCPFVRGAGLSCMPSACGDVFCCSSQAQGLFCAEGLCHSAVLQGSLEGKMVGSMCCATCHSITTVACCRTVWRAACCLPGRPGMACMEHPRAPCSGDPQACPLQACSQCRSL